MNWPAWWGWELDLSFHLEKRMLLRDFTEIDSRTMLDQATGYHPDLIEGRWIVVTTHRYHLWEIIVEPDFLERSQFYATTLFGNYLP